MAYRLLSVNDLPNVDFPNHPGVGDATGAQAGDDGIDGGHPAGATIAGIDSMTSTSRLGATQITIQFTLSRDTDGAAPTRAVGDRQGRPSPARRHADAGDVLEGQPPLTSPSCTSRSAPRSCRCTPSSGP
jgi:hypothetical protein